MKISSRQGTVTLHFIGPRRQRRSAQDAKAHTDPYAELTKRMMAVLADVNHTTHDDNPNHVPAGTSAGGQFASGPGGPKPNAVKATNAKHGVHELLSSGHPFTKSELAAVLGIKPELVQTYLFMLKSPKHAGAKEALNIKKMPNGSFIVEPKSAEPEVEKSLLESTTETPLADLLVKKVKAKMPAPAKPAEPAPMPNLLDDEPPKKANALDPANGVGVPMPKHEADVVYKAKVEEYQDTCAMNCQTNPQLAKIAVSIFKQEKHNAMQQWKANVTGQPATTTNQTMFESDKILAKELATMSVPMDQAFANWKVNTTKEKAGVLTPQPPAEPVKPTTPTTPVVSAPVMGKTKYKDLVPKGFTPIQKADLDTFGSAITALKAKLEAHSVDAVGNKKSIQQHLTERLAKAHNWQAMQKLKGPYAQSTEAACISSWAGSSGNGNCLSNALQIATRDAFGIPDHALEMKQLSALHSHGEDQVYRTAAASLSISLPHNDEAALKTFKLALQEFAHAQYEHTQDRFKAMGITHMVLARGMKIKAQSHRDAKAPTNIKLQPLSSFSTNYGTARTFAGGDGTVFLTKVPIEQIIGSYLTGYGCSNEHEVVVLGHEDLKTYAISKASAVSAGEAANKIKARVTDAASDEEFYYSPDADTVNADWTKQAWDLPPYGSREFFDIMGPGYDDAHFQTTPVYLNAVEKGLILDGEWVGPGSPIPDPRLSAPSPDSEAPKRKPKVFIHYH